MSYNLPEGWNQNKIDEALDFQRERKEKMTTQDSGKDFDKIALKIIDKTFGIPADYEKSDLQDDIVKALKQARADALEEAAKYEDSRVAHFQACMNNEKQLGEENGHIRHQQNLWEYQALRDEHIQSAKAIRSLAQPGGKDGK